VAERPTRPQWRVTRGVPESLALVPDHRAVEGIDRVRLIDGARPAGAMVHCAVHFVSAELAPEPAWRYTLAHAHELDEVNIILSERGVLRYRYEVDGVVEIVESPATVFLPAGSVHRMEACGGTGVLICIQLLPEGGR
jgi:mannose-6-phosphate isomerase-like protein (cupin superfamily)